MPKQNAREHVWNEADLKLAVNVNIGQKMRYLDASKHFKILRSISFRYCIPKKNFGQIKKNKLGRKPFLT